MDPNIIHDYLKSGSYPKHASKLEKRKIRSCSKRYVIKNCRLFWTNRKGQVREVILERTEQTKVLEKFHDNRGHMGIEKTFYAISSEVYWRNLYDDVQQYVKSCSKCQLATKFEKENTVKPIPVVSPWHHVCIDLVQMPLSKNGNRYILTVVDFFTKWAEAFPLRDKTSQSVATELYKLFLHMGFPSIYSSDRGREFVNSILTNMMQKMRCRHRVSSAYHPQTQGLVEKFNHTIQNMLHKTCDTKDEWDEHLDEVTFAYRNVVQKSTKKTPFEVMFGRLPTEEDAVVSPTVVSEDETMRTIENLKHVRHDIRSIVKKNVKTAQAKNGSEAKAEDKKFEDSV
ncbi:hypothetical protein FSP39_008357 [Pinctada imbricata]|uniref:Integrase catalytic domain-containing protein n=1 Tax=Pinctada imbricata TaxID=66713 RepID=A0AA89C3G7_PINIB|nr:hypothetical protein FSP39_008357 [Pinctada imbricata]